MRPRLWEIGRVVTIAVPLFVPISHAAVGQQVADTTFFVDVREPAYSPGHGPLVLLDEAHHNYHTADGRYLAFATLLRRDGYRVQSSTEQFTSRALGGAAVLVIANALHESNVSSWSLPTPSAFTDEEIAAVVQWVREGGALLLIADHMPMPGAAGDLAESFGIEFLNGFAAESDNIRGPITFRRADGSLRSHPIVEGRNPRERVDSVASFTGQAFQLDAGAAPIMVMRPGTVSLNPQVAWQFSDSTPQTDVSGWSQGATVVVGEGRAAFFGEAAMFTAQVQGPNRLPMGMNRPDAAQNQQFLLNVMHWLSGLINAS